MTHPDQPVDPVSPPPLPPTPLPYAGPKQDAPVSGAQVVFDTVTGPNLRLWDNLIQLACVIVGTAAGVGVAKLLGQQRYAGVGGAIGLLGSLILSGAVIGIVRALRVRKSRRR